MVRPVGLAPTPYYDFGYAPQAYGSANSPMSAFEKWKGVLYSFVAYAHVHNYNKVSSLGQKPAPMASAMPSR